MDEKPTGEIDSQSHQQASRPGKVVAIEHIVFGLVSVFLSLSSAPGRCGSVAGVHVGGAEWWAWNWAGGRACWAAWWKGMAFHAKLNVNVESTWPHAVVSVEKGSLSPEEEILGATCPGAFPVTLRYRPPECALQHLASQRGLCYGVADGG